MGFAIQRGATCTVAAAAELVEKRRAQRLASMVEASGRLPALACGGPNEPRVRAPHCQRQVQITSSELSSPDCARSVKRWAMR